MANLSSKQRSSIKTSNFALPAKAKTASAKRKSGNYPIPDKNHARAALSMVSRYGTSAEKKQVRSAVKKKYPDIGKTAAKKTTGRSKGKK